MRANRAIATMLAAALVAAPLTGLTQGHGGGGGGASQHHAPTPQGQRDLDRDRIRAQDRVVAPDRDRDRIQDRTHAPNFAKLGDEDIYGSELMSAQERNAYRKALQNAATTDERARIEAQHRQEIQVRAENKGVNVVAPGKGIYGGAMMSVEERNRYREQLRLLENDPQARAKFMAEHKEMMQARAKARGTPAADVP